MQEESGKHLYGVMGRTDEAALESQRQGGTFYPVSYKELSALVSDAPCVDYRGLGKDLLFRRLLDHQRVIEGVMHSHSVIPFRFGSLARTEKEVKQILIQGYSLFKALLPWVGERVELEMAAIWDKENIFKYKGGIVEFVEHLNEKKNHASWYLCRRGRRSVISADPSHPDRTATHQSARRRRTKVG